RMLHLNVTLQKHLYRDFLSVCSGNHFASDLCPQEVGILVDSRFVYLQAFVLFQEGLEGRQHFITDNKFFRFQAMVVIRIVIYLEIAQTRDLSSYQHSSKLEYRFNPETSQFQFSRGELNRHIGLNAAAAVHSASRIGVLLVVVVYSVLVTALKVVVIKRSA